MKPRILFRSVLALTLLACSEGADTGSALAGKADHADATSTGPLSLVCVDAQGQPLDVTLSPNGAPSGTLPAASGLVQAKLASRDFAVDLTMLRPALNVAITDDPNVLDEFIEFHEGGQLAPTPGGQPKLQLRHRDDQTLTLAFDNGRTAITAQCNRGLAQVTPRLNFRFQTAASLVAALPAGAKVGFDIDDTLLFSKPAMARGLVLSDDAGDELFWSEVNRCGAGCAASDVRLPNGGVMRLPAVPASPAKPTVQELVALHLAAGHQVYAITARRQYGDSYLRNYLNSLFQIPTANVYFEPNVTTASNLAGKGDRIMALGLDVFYGDADSDITDANEVGVPGVRILRSPLSSYRKGEYLTKYAPGYFGETILADSYE